MLLPVVVPKPDFATYDIYCQSFKIKFRIQYLKCETFLN